MTKWIAAARYEEFISPVFVAAVTPSIVPDGPITSADWGKDIPEHIPEGFVRRVYRVSDDTVFTFGYPYIVAWMYKGKLFDGASHFYKWQCYGPMFIMAGDEQGNDYGLDAGKLKSILSFIGEQQDVWCSRYHRCDADQEKPSEDEQIPTNFKSLGDLIAQIASKAQKPPKGSP